MELILDPSAGMLRMERTDPEEAFDRFVAESHGSIRRLVHRLLGWKLDPDAVVQDAYLAAWSAWSRRPTDEGIDSWLKRIAINKCRGAMRREMVRSRWRKWIGLPPDAGLDADRVEVDETARQVREAVRRLQAMDREVIVLHYLESMDVDAMAASLGIGRNAVEVRLHRARKRLEPLLARLVEP